MPFLDHGDVKIHFETWGSGEGPWITLVNGYTRPLTDFKAMGRYFAERGYRALAFDNRGAGEAECPPVFTLEDMAGDITALWDHLGCAKSHLLGMAYGAVIATLAASAQPARVDRLILAAAPLTTRFLMLETKAPSRIPRRLEAELLLYFSPSFTAKERLLVQGFMRQMAKIYQEPDTSLGARAQRATMEDFDLGPLLARIPSPTLVLHGEDDRVVAVQSGKEVAGHLADAKLEIFPGVGHLLLVEMPLKFYETVEIFCRGESREEK